MNMKEVEEEVIVEVVLAGRETILKYSESRDTNYCAKRESIFIAKNTYTRVKTNICNLNKPALELNL